MKNANKSQMLYDAICKMTGKEFLNDADVEKILHVIKEGRLTASIVE